MAFRAYSTLTVGDTIKVEYNEKIYLINVLEVKPENYYHAITIVEADVQVDFAPPLDYVEPSSIVTPAPTVEDQNVANTEQVVEEAPPERFTGTYYTIRDAKPKEVSRSEFAKSAPTQPIQVPKNDEVVFKTRELKKSTPNGGTNSRKRRKRGEKIESEEPEEKKPALVPFSGKGYSLKEVSRNK